MLVALLLGMLLGAMGMRWLMNRQEPPVGPAEMQNSTLEPTFTQPAATAPEKLPEEVQPQETVAQTLPQETEPSATVPPETMATEPEILAYCNACKSWRADVENWMCTDCAKEGGKCSQCGERVSKLEDGVCEACRATENTEAPEANCIRCGTPSYDLVNGVCPDCAEKEVLSYCQACKMWSTGVKDGLCAICAREGGKCSQCGQLVSKLKDGICLRCESNEETATCAYCQGEFPRSEVDEASGLCSECSWKVGVCQGCGKLSADLLDGYCPACTPSGQTEVPEEICSLCGTDLVDGVCQNCTQTTEPTESTEPTAGWVPAL